MNATNQSATCIKTLIHTDNVRVAEFKMIADSIGDRHYHSFVSEYCVCLKGQFQIKMDDGTIHFLSAGDTINIPAKIPHQLINPGKMNCRYMVIQSGGLYDFKTMTPV